MPSGPPRAGQDLPEDTHDKQQACACVRASLIACRSCTILRPLQRSGRPTVGALVHALRDKFSATGWQCTPTAVAWQIHKCMHQSHVIHPHVHAYTSLLEDKRSRPCAFLVTVLSRSPGSWQPQLRSVRIGIRMPNCHCSESIPWQHTLDMDSMHGIRRCNASHERPDALDSRTVPSYIASKDDMHR